MEIVVAGGGVGGMTAALALQKAGHAVTICEQAGAYGQIGADVNLTPNAVHALDGLGLRPALEATAARPEFRISRTGDSGEETSRLPMSAAAEAKYGAPQLTIHRADLLDALRGALAPGTIRLGARAAGILEDGAGATLLLADGSRMAGDLVVGADGIHSVVRAALFGPDRPRFTGLVSWRGTVPREKLAGIPDLDSFTKWWGQTSDRQIVSFPLRRGAEIFVFATTPLDGWSEEGWTLPGDVAELRAAYADFHPHARALLAACDAVTRSALHVRDPMPQWSKGRVTVLGDAAHPMVPFMAQGACMAIEDGVVLARAIDAAPDVPSALSAYEAARRERTARVQQGSLANDWLRQGGNADWVYAYDAWADPVGGRQAA